LRRRKRLLADSKTPAETNPKVAKQAMMVTTTATWKGCFDAHTNSMRTTANAKNESKRSRDTVL
jgi:hypothetical protein